MKKRIGKGINVLLVILGVAITVFIAAVVTGTIIYFTWPIAIPVVLPALVKAGMLPVVLSWKVAVCFSWLLGALFAVGKTK
jgi:hypothetical protein